MFLRGFLLFIVLFSTVVQASYTTEQPLHNYQDQITIKADYAWDSSISENIEIIPIYLEIDNNSEYNFRIEPHYNSYILANGKKYFRVNPASDNAFLSGFIEAKNNRKGFIYFKKPQEEHQNIELVIKNIKIYDKKSKPFTLKWNFSKAAAIASTGQAPQDNSSAISDIPTTLNYATQLAVISSIPEPDINSIKIEMKNRAVRGENLKISAYMPTGVEANNVTAVIGIANYTTLNKENNGIFTGYFRVPEIFDPGTYVVSFHILLNDNDRQVIQQLLEITP
jgi:hypothetical protein